MNSTWCTYPSDATAFDFSGQRLRDAWAVLHAGNNEPFPEGEAAQDAWRCYHEGKFEEAAAKGAAAGGEGLVAAAFATTNYAHYLEPSDARKAELLDQLIGQCRQAFDAGSRNKNLQYMYAVALGRRSQLLSPADALAEGYAALIKEHVDVCLALDAEHAEAHALLGAWNASVVEGGGPMMAKMMYGASEEDSLVHCERAIARAPASPIPHLTLARALEGIFGVDAEAVRIKQLLQTGLGCKPADAMQCLEQRDVRKHFAALL